MAKDNSTSTPGYSQFACIGAGVSGIGLGSTLQRWYGITDVRLFERNDDVGGTWLTNSYPGVAVDIPSSLYSLSYATTPEWTRILPKGGELHDYLLRVTKKYNLREKVTFNTDVQRCEWSEENGTWTMTLKNTETGDIFFHECQFLFSATGQLLTPRKLDVPGIEKFKGPVVHTSRWRYDGKDIDLTNKKVIVIGNGCTGVQLVPKVVAQAAHVTHIVRSKHWILPPIDEAVPGWVRGVFKWVPGAMLLHRLLLFVVMERSFAAFYLTAQGQKARDLQRETYTRYIKETAPEKYHDLLIPDFEVGCKRRIWDAGYLKALHSDNITLTNEKPVEILPEGIRTTKGVIEADIIILANGFQTNNPMNHIEVIGRNGQTVEQHWDSFGGAEAYNSSIMNGFPNFFMLLGPNSVTGHTSTIIASENSINYALRIIKPILNGQAGAVEVKRDAEEDYVDKVQASLLKTVFATGCGAWYSQPTSEGKEWNASTYPWGQPYYWYRSLFPDWKDLSYSGPQTKASWFGVGYNHGYGKTLLTGLTVAGLLAWKNNYVRVPFSS